jgi:hypothetical protein
MSPKKLPGKRKASDSGLSASSTYSQVLSASGSGSGDAAASSGTEELVALSSGSGYGGHGGHGGHGGYGGTSYHSVKEPCCPLVVDPLCLLAILGGIAAATYLLNIVITMKLGRRKKRADASTQIGAFDFFSIGMQYDTTVYEWR